MKSLTDLNNYASNTNNFITFTDLRPAGVIFDYPTARDINRIYAESYEIIVERKIEIVEIIKPEIADVKFILNLSGVLGATVDFGTLPIGTSFVKVGDTYTVSGIDAVSDWDAVKAPTITLPDDFFGFFFYTCTISYFDELIGRRNSVQWQGGIDAPQVLYEVESTASIDIGVVYNVPLNLNSFFVVDRFEADIISITYLDATFTIQAQLSELKFGNVNVQANTGISAIGNYTIVGIGSSLDTLFSFVTDINVINMLTNYKFNRQYNSYQKNKLFTSLIPQIDDGTATGTYKLELTSPNGDFGNSTSATTGTYTFIGTKNEVNNIFSEIYFWPDDDFTSNTTFTLKLYRNDTLYINQTNNLNHNVIGSTQNIYEFTSSSNWTPSFEDLRYCDMDYLIVAGGGGGYLGYYNNSGDKLGSGGGGAGQYIFLENQTLLDQTYTVTVGSGGAKTDFYDQFGVFVPGIGYTAYPGGDSVFNGATASGGKGGRKYFISGPDEYTGGIGGDSGNGFVGVSGSIDDTDFNFEVNGGGGAGATSNGFTNGNGGTGYTNSISGILTTYAEGAPGGNSGLPVKTTYGSGGKGGGGDAQNSSSLVNNISGGYDGNNGIVIIKTQS